MTRCQICASKYWYHINSLGFTIASYSWGKVSRENQGLALKRPDSLREVPERRSDEDVNSCWGKFSQKRRVNLYIQRGDGPIKTTPLIQYNLPSSTENLTRKTEKNNT